MEWVAAGWKAQRTLERVIEAARRDATKWGLTAVSLDRIAEAAQLSKSGVVSRCRSVPELQLGVAYEWRSQIERMAAEVAGVESGVGAAWAFCREWLAHPELRGAPLDVLRGAPSLDPCAADLRARRAVAAGVRVMSRALCTSLGQARESGELVADAEVERLAFELESLLLSWPWAARAFGVPSALERIATSCRAVLEAACADGREPLPAPAPAPSPEAGDAGEAAPSGDEDDPQPLFPGAEPPQF